MSTQEYYRKKAEYAKSLHERGLPWVKAYGVVRDGDKFLVLKWIIDGKTVYELAGGGVEENETPAEGIVREIREELNIEVEIIRELGVYDKMVKTWRLDDEAYDIPYEIHVFETKLKKRLKSKTVGVEGEYENNKAPTALVDKKTLLTKVAEFTKMGFKLD